MPEGASRLPERPSLEQLKKQAKERAKQSDSTLSDAQLALAREYGFDSWPKLAHYVERVARFARLAEDLQREYRYGDEAALRRFSEIMNVWFSPQELRVRLRRDIEAGLAGKALSMDEARTLVAWTYGFASWAKLLESAHDAQTPKRANARVTLSDSPPFYRIDWENKRLELRPPPLDSRDWDTIVAVMKEHELTRFGSGGLITDDGMARLARLENITEMHIESKHLTDDGVKRLAHFPLLEELQLGGSFTDRGLEVLRALPRLRVFKMYWRDGITDAGAANLTFCEQLETVDLMGTSTGDGTINALTGKRHLSMLKSGKLVTDAALPLLHRFPVFKTGRQSEPAIGLMDPMPRTSSLMLDGPITNQGLRALEGLEGLFALGLFWHTTALTEAGLAVLKDLPALGALNCRGEIMSDTALAHVAAIPRLRMLVSQDMAAGPAGFAALGRSRSLEYLWGRECAGFESSGFLSLAGIPSLRGLGISLARVDDAALSLLPTIPRLQQLVPIDVTDAGFRHVGQCTGLENLWCMYCRETGDEATAHLSRLRLKSYYAGSTRITDASLEILGDMDSLEKLEFWECGGITDAGLPHLARLPNLKSVGLESPRITRDGIAVFPPHVRVDYHSS